MDTNYLTPEGLKNLRRELKYLLDEDRPQVVHAVSVAAAMGDRSENAEYIYGKRRLREIDRRIRFLQDRLEKVEVVDPTKISTQKVSFGAWVTVCDHQDNENTYQIIGPDEVDSQKGRITFSSPLGKALLGKEVGAEISIRVPKGKLSYTVLEIRSNKN